RLLGVDSPRFRSGRGSRSHSFCQRALKPGTRWSFTGWTVFFRVHRNKSLLRRARYTRRGDFSEARQRHFGPGPTSLRAGIRVRRRAGPRPETRAGAALARLAGPAVLGQLDHRLALPALDVELAVPDAFDERLPLLGGVDEDVAFGVLGHPQGHQAVVGVADLQGRGRAVGARRAFPAGRRHVELALERMLTL